MPQSTLSPQEQRLSAFCRVFAAVYLLGGLFFAAFPRQTFRIATLGGETPAFGPEAQFWNVLAAAMMAAAGTACWVTAGRPRERRHAILPVVAAKLTSSALAAVLLLGGPRSRALLAVLVTDLPLFLLTLAVYRSAAPGVSSEPAREGPPPVDEEAPPVKLKVSKR